MNRAQGYRETLLRNLQTARERAGVSRSELEERLILGPGWISRFEEGETTPSIDMILTILHEIGASLGDLLIGLPSHPDAAEIERFIFAEQAGRDLLVNFRYAGFDALYKLESATIQEFEAVIRTLRDGLSKLRDEEDKATKANAVTSAFLKAMELWPHANPSDVWWFIIYRAYCDPYNHPATFARLNFDQSWKRTGGWALEQVLVRFYSPFLKTHGINISIPDTTTKQAIINAIDVGERLEADKMDVLLTGGADDEFFGVVNVKASFAERRTDDVPMSAALARSGYVTPLWTMDCKSMPSERPVNRGELGGLEEDKKSAKRRDIEDEGYFTGCFSYNRNTLPSPETLPSERRVYVCDFRNPDDAFSRFIIHKWQGRLEQ